MNNMLKEESYAFFLWWIGVIATPVLPTDPNCFELPIVGYGEAIVLAWED